MLSVTNKALVSYIQEDNFSGFESFLETRKGTLDDRDENGTSALMAAAQRGRVKFVKSLVEHGADINAEDADNWTPLLFATKEGHEDIAVYLLDHGATVDHRDMGGWTALMWACYKGRVKAARKLIEKGADVNAYGNYNVSCLGWAAGRNHVEIAKDLIQNGAKVNAGDKYGTTPLIWAARKGNLEIVQALLKAGSMVDACGMTSWTALLVATAGSHVEVVKALLEYRPNVNALDKDACSALTIACKEGFHEIALSLVNAGAYININDRGGSSNLIHAAKGGHRSIVDALLKKHADVNVQGKDRKTALYWAVEKSHVGVVKSILAANPDLELATKDGDTPLMRAVRNRNLEIVSLLLDKRAKVNTADRNGDTCLHIAMRARSKQIAELFLRNPVNSQLLYRPNRAGETPYNIDRSSAKPVITQLFGSRGLNTQEDFENLLGYNLYSSALADMLSDPTLNMPITIGLFARWGSGKSFLLSKLKEEMKSFARQWFNPVFIWSVLLFVVVLWLAVVMGVILGLSLWSWKFGLGFAAGIVILVHTFLFVVWFCSERSKYEWTWSHKLASFIAVKMESLRLVLQVVFCHPAGSLSNDNIQALPINFYFTEQAKISSTSGGENSLNQMLLSLYACLENDYGTFATRLFRAFRPKPVSAHASWRWRKLCCIPYWIISSGCFALTLVGIVVLCLFYFDNSGINQYTLVVIMYICATVVGLLVVANLYTIGQVLKAIVFSHKHHLQKAVNKINAVKSDGFLYAMKAEVNMLSDMARCLDSFTGRQSRMVVIVDGLDSGEQDKVLQVLDAVHILFSDNRAPFIILLAIDPHIISKGIEMNINPVLNDANVGGQDYLRNLVHLPFYLQNAALRKVKQVKMLETSMKKNEDGNPILSARRPSVESNMGLSLALDRYDKVASKKAKRLGLKMSDSIASSLGTNINKIGAGPGDLKKMLLGDDYFSDVNPRSMRRLMNIIHITGRLLKAFNFDFNWHHLSTWVNLTEQWPYRLSWLIIYCEVLQKELEDSLSLKTVFDRVRPFIPASKELDPNLGLDRDEKKLDVYLGVHKNSLLISTLYIFLPFTISLDPQLRKDITEQYQPNEQMFKQSPGSYKPAIQPPPSPYMNPNYNHSLRYRQLQNARPQVSLSTTAVQSYYQPPVPSNPVSTYPNVWPFPPPVSSAFPPPVSAAFPPPVSSFFAPESLIGQELKSVRLSTLSVEGVCDMLAKLPSIKTTAVERYQETLRANNIGGRVLMCCDLSELKLVLGMTFGDWEIFKSAIITLRENATLGEMLSHRSEAMTETSVLINVTSPEKERQSSVASAQKNEMAEFRKTLKPNVLEKQITMEDQMITGALELLNDDAKEDARKGEEAGTSNATLSPVNSEPELANSRRTSKAFEEQDETDVLYVTGTSTNVTAELPDSPTILRRLESEKALFSLVNESIPPNSSYTDASSLEMPHPSSSQNPSPTVPASHPRHSAYQTPTPPHHSPARKRSSLKRTPVSRTQSSASNLSPSAVSHRRNRDDKSTGRQVPKTPEDERKKGGGGSKRVSSQPGFRIGSNSSSDVSSDESQTPLVSRGSAGGGGQIRKVNSSTKPQ